jgi:EmrB/QacA subfamily drug resistance transporter
LSAVAEAAPAAAAARPRIWVVFGGLMLVLLIAALDQTIVATALPTIAGELGGLEHISWVVTAYLLAQTAVTPLYGKLGDLYQRKVVLQSAVLIFLAGSALCGASQTMTELIVFRGLQGLGAGGLIVLTQAAIGDIVSPRERGRYLGYFGAVFGVASVLGPLLGGFFTSELDWRWIFYVNLPIGAVALIVLAASFPATGERRRHRIDYLGAGLLAGALSAAILFTSLGGTTYDWNSGFMIGVGAAGIVLLGAFIAVERRAPEPVLPLDLYSNRVVVVASGIGLVIGFALFGSITYLPLFFQLVNGLTPTESGLQIVPLMVGVLVASTLAGQLVTRRGRYKVFPVVGTAVTAVGLYLLSLMDADTGGFEAAAFMLVVGIGLGLVMQVLILAVQNAVDYAELGVATSSATMFRSIGGALGTAILGAVFTNTLDSNLAEADTGGASLSAASSLDPGQIDQLPAPVQATFVNAFTDSLNVVFVVAAAVAVLGFVVSWFLRELPLRETVTTTHQGHAFAAPSDNDSLSEIGRALSVLARRDVRRRVIEQITARAGVRLSPAAAWLLYRFSADPGAQLDQLSATYGVPLDELRAGAAELESRGLVTPDGAGALPGRLVTDDGSDALDRLVAARRERLGELLEGWSPEQHAEVAALLTQLSHELSSEAHAEVRA